MGFKDDNDEGTYSIINLDNTVLWVGINSMTMEKDFHHFKAIHS